MKSLVLFLAMLFSISALCAQEVDTVNYYDADEDYEEYDSYTGEDEEEAVTHSLVDPETLTPAYKTEKISVKKFDPEKWKKVVGPANYDEEAKKPEPEEEKEETKERGIPWNSDVFRLISYMVILCVLILLVSYVVKNTSPSRKIRTKVIDVDNLTEAVENIEDVDVLSALQQAVAAGNFRLAARLYYLDLLKKLNEHGVIVWKKDKTNREYLAEIFSRNYYFDEVKNLTLAYEQAWYGEHTLTTESFQQLSENFESIRQKINTPRIS